MKRRRVIDSSDDESSDDGGPSEVIDLSDEKEEGPLAEHKGNDEVVMEGGEVREFRLRPKKGQAILLTYPQALSSEATQEEQDGAKVRLRDWLEAKSATQWIVVCEPHSDGGWHFHALVRLARGFDSRNPAVLDWEGKHPNIQQSRGPQHIEAWKKYLTVSKKEGGAVDPNPLLNWSEFAPFIQLAMEGDVAAAERLVMIEDPMKYLISREPIRKSLTALSSTHSPILKTTTRKVESFRFSSACISHLWATDIDQVVPEELFGPAPWDPDHVLSVMLSTANGRPIVLAGKSGVGKTEIAMMLATKATGSYHLVSEMDDLKTWIRGTMLFDDVELGHMPRKASLHLLDVERERAIWCRYGNPRLPENRHVIFTTNEIDKLFKCDEEFDNGSWPCWRGDAAMRRRVGLTVVFGEDCPEMYEV